MEDKKKPEIDMGELEKITKKVFAYRPSKHRKRKRGKQEKPKQKPPPE
ncbi:MAG: hypothetical protein OXF86_00540 [Caldilineaceae bacterium]|nr:hypothetical protein [Caldilineaceae bacterium]